MDIEFFKSIPEDQMEMMMMMQLDKLPDFCGIYSHDMSETTTDPSSMGFGGSPNNLFSHDQQTMENGPSTFLNMPSSNISFTSLGCSSSQGGHGHGGAAAASAGHEMSFISNSGNGKWRSNGNGMPTQEQKRNSMAAMREMIFRIAAMQPIHIDPESVKPPKRRNVKISKDPQSVAARHRRERISERIRILQRLVPGGTKMDTASMLDEAIHYVKFLKNQVQSLERAAVTSNRPTGIGFPVPMSSGNGNYMGGAGMGNKACQAQAQAAQSVQHYLDA